MKLQNSYFPSYGDNYLYIRVPLISGSHPQIISNTFSFKAHFFPHSQEATQRFPLSYLDYYLTAAPPRSHLSWKRTNKNFWYNLFWPTLKKVFHSHLQNTLVAYQTQITLTAHKAFLTGSHLLLKVMSHYMPSLTKKQVRHSYCLFAHTLCVC